MKGEVEHQSLGTTFTVPFRFFNWPIVTSEVAFPLCVSFKKNENFFDLLFRPLGHGASHWIWNEGSPQEILEFEGQKVLILDKAFLPKPLKVVRTFETVKGNAQISKFLTEEETEEFVKKLAQQTPATRELARQKNAFIHQ